MTLPLPKGPHGQPQQPEWMNYYCDKKRHLVCRPYSVATLHRMAAELGIARAWFHSGDKPHYDIPARRQAEIQAACHVVSPRQILAIMQAPMYILLVTIDGQTRADTVTALRRTLELLEAGEDKAKHEDDTLSYSFTLNPPVATEAQHPDSSIS